jgi:hypothetical protein
MTIRSRNFDPIKVAEHRDVFANLLEGLECGAERKRSSGLCRIPSGLDDSVGDIEKGDSPWWGGVGG